MGDEGLALVDDAEQFLVSFSLRSVFLPEDHGEHDQNVARRDAPDDGGQEKEDKHDDHCGHGGGKHKSRAHGEPYARDQPQSCGGGEAAYAAFALDDGAAAHKADAGNGVGRYAARVQTDNGV